MLPLLVYLCIFLEYSFTITFAAPPPCTPGQPCIVDCTQNTNGTNPCAGSIINGSLALNLTVNCGSELSCFNTTTYCPSINSASSCYINCYDSLSCDTMTINSASPKTELNCGTDDLDKTNICSNDITVNLMSPANITLTPIISLSVNCSISFGLNPTTDTQICNDIMVNVDDNVDTGNAYFICQGSYINCQNIDVTAGNMHSLQLTLDGKESNLNSSYFQNKDYLDIFVNGDNANIADTMFTGIMNDAGQVAVDLREGTVLSGNSFNFSGGLTLFTMNGAPTGASSNMINGNVINVTNSGSTQSLSIVDVNGDKSNTVNANALNSLSIICDSELSDGSICGNIGTINAGKTEQVMIFIGKDANFSSIVNANDAVGINLTVLEGGAINNLTLNAQGVSQVNFNNYGVTSGRNVIDASAVTQGLFINCYQSGNCTDDLEIYTTPQKTNITCYSTSCDRLTLNVQDTADELGYNMQNCSCKQERKNLCIPEWDITCGDGTKTATIQNGKCTGDCCGGVIDKLSEKYPNPYICPKSNATNYICEEGKECVIDCDNTNQFNATTGFQCSGSNANNQSNIIDASHAESLSVSCDSKTGVCSNLKIICPNGERKDRQSCELDCTQSGACSNLAIDTLQSEQVEVNCMEDGSCTSIMIDNAPSNGANETENSIKIESIKGAISNIQVDASQSTLSPKVQFDCKNGSCANININNNNGITYVSLAGSNGGISYSSISGNELTFAASGKDMTLKENKFIMISNGTINSSLAGGFPTNFFNTMQQSITVSANGTMNFTKSNNEYNFTTAQQLELGLTDTQTFTNNIININQGKSVEITNNGGHFYGNAINADQANLFALYCYGNCFTEEANSPNIISIENVPQSFFYVGNDILNSQSIQIGGSNSLLAADIFFFAQSGGQIQNLSVGVIPVSIDVRNIAVNNGTSKTENVSIYHNSNLLEAAGDNIGIELTGNLFEYTLDVSKANNTMLTLKSNTFQGGVIKTNPNGILDINATSTATFLNNTIDDTGLGNDASQDSIYNLSINDPDQGHNAAGIRLVKTPNLYTFFDADTIQITTQDENQIFSNNVIVVVNQMANVIIENNGVYSNNTIASDALNQLDIRCNGYCYDQESNVINNYNITSITATLSFTVGSGDTISDDNTKLAVNKIGSLFLAINDKGNLNNFNQFDNVTISDQVRVMNNGGNMNNVSIDADMADYFTLTCMNSGCSNGKSPNMFSLNNVPSLTINVQDDVLSPNNSILSIGPNSTSYALIVTVKDSDTIDDGYNTVFTGYNFTTSNSINIESNAGVLDNLTLNATSATTFQLNCENMGCSYIETVENQIILNKVGTVQIAVTNGTFNGQKQELIGLADVTTLRFTAENASIADIRVDNNGSDANDISLKAVKGGLFANLSIDNVAINASSSAKVNASATTVSILAQLLNATGSDIGIGLLGTLFDYEIDISSVDNTNISLNSYEFSEGIIHTNPNGILDINGTSDAIFSDNTIDDTNGGSQDSIFQLFINSKGRYDELSGIGLRKTPNQYTFMKADLIQITTTPTSIFTNNNIEVMNPDANIIIDNNGVYTNNTIKSDAVTILDIRCNGVCYDKTADTFNSYNVNKITGKLAFTVGSGDTISDANTRFPSGDKTVNSLSLTVQREGILNHFNQFDSITFSDGVEVLNDDGIMNNVSIKADNAQYFTFICQNRGCMKTTTPNMFTTQDVATISLTVQNDVLTPNSTVLSIGSATDYALNIIVGDSNSNDTVNTTLRDFNFTTTGSMNIQGINSTIIDNLLLDATSAKEFQLSCIGKACDFIKSGANQIIVNKAQSVQIGVSDGILESDKQSIIGLNTVSVLGLTAVDDGTVSNFTLDTAENVTLTTVSGGIIQDIQLVTGMMDTIQVLNDGGIMKSILIQPKKVNAIIIDSSNAGILENSTINTTATNFTVSCENNGCSFIESKKSPIVVNNVQFVQIAVSGSNATLDGSKVDIIGLADAGTIDFTAKNTGTISNFTFNNSASDKENVLLSTMNGGIINNIQLVSTMSSVQAINNGGKMRSISIKPMSADNITVKNRDGGIFENLLVNATVDILCLSSVNNSNGSIFFESDKNQINATAADYVQIGASNDVINGGNLKIIGLDGVPAIDLFTANNGAITNLTLNKTQSVLLSAKDNGMFENVQVLADNMDTIQVVNNGGMMNLVSLEPKSVTDIMIYSSNADVVKNSVINPKCTNFYLTCMELGCSFIQSGQLNNSIILNTTELLQINVSQVTLDGANMNFIGLNDTSMLNLIAQNGGWISNFTFDNVNSDSENILLSTMPGGILDNIQLVTAALGTVKAINKGGIMNSIAIEPTKANNIIVNSVGNLSDSIIDGTNAQNLSVSCANITNAFCENVTLHVTESSSASSKLICDGFGCQDLIFYTKTNIDDIELELTGCPCETALKSSCVKKRWNIYCDAASTPSIFYTNNTCVGDCCGNIGTDLRVSGCDYPNGGGSSKKKSKAGAIVGGVCGGILFIVLIAGGVYYYKKKQAASRESLLVNADS